MKTLANFFRLLLALVLLAGCTGTPTAQVTPSAQPSAAPAKATPQATPASDLTALLKMGGAIAPALMQSAAGALAEDGAIELAFDQPMNPDTTAGALVVTGPDGAKVSGSVSWPDPALLRFKPAQALKADSVYQVRVGEKATSAKGVAIKDVARLDVSTSGAVQVAQVFPADKTQSLAVDSAITVLFTRPIVPLTIAEEQSGLPTPIKIDPPVEGKGEWVNTSVFLFHPAKALLTNTTYTVTVPAGLKDAAGKLVPLAQDYTWRFTTTAPAVDRLKMRDRKNQLVEYDESSSNVLDMPLDPAFSLKFFQAMDTASVTAALTLTPDKGQPVALKTTWAADQQAVEFTPTERLELGRAYTLALSTDARAADGSPMPKIIQWAFTTVRPPAVDSTEPQDGSKSRDFYFKINFASPMNLTSVLSHISFNPPLELKNNYYYDEQPQQHYSLMIYGLAPSTNYTVQLQPGMADLYGNVTQAATTVHFTTGPRTAEAWLMMPGQPMYRAGASGPDGGDVFYARLVNVHTVTFSLFKLNEQQFYDFQYSKSSSRPDKSLLVWQKEIQNEAAQDQVKFLKLPISGEEGASALPVGFYLLGVDTPDISYPGRAFLDQRAITVADSNLMLKVGPDEALAWVTDLTSGKPVANAPVTLYDQQNKQVSQGQTDADGLVKLPIPRRGQEFVTYTGVVEDAAGTHFAYGNSGWGSGVSPYQYGIWEAYYEPPTPQITYLYTDRPIYRPGQPVYFKGIVRADDDLHYTLPTEKEINIVIRNYKNESVYDEKLPISDMGTFNGMLTLDSEAALGTYTIQAIYPSETNYIGFGSFTVAEYRRPEFQIKLEAAPGDVLSGQDFSANLKAEYYSGGGVANAAVKWTLRTEPFSFTPPTEFSRFSFVDYNFDAFYELYNQQPNQPGDNLLAEGSGQTDAQGQLTLTLPAKLKTDASQTLVLETTITDFAGTVVSGRTQVIAHRSAVYPGIRFNGYIGVEGEKQTIDLVALDWSGKALGGQVVDVQVVERRWNSVQEQDERGNLTWKSSIEEIPVQTFSGVALDSAGRGSLTFTPPNGGIFKATVTARDAKGNTGVASTELWVTGKDYIPWRQTNDRGFQLVTDRTEYRPGDTAQVMIASPFQGEATALVTIERGRIRKQEVIRLESNSTLYKLPITGDMAPNVYLSVMVVKGVDETNPRPNFKVGMAEIKVSTDLQQVKVKVEADKPSAGPGETVTYTVTTTDYAGAPLAAEVSLGLSDLATLSLAPPNSLPIMQGFYDRRGLRIMTAMAMINNIEDFNASIKELEAQAAGGGMGSGGGKGEGDLGVMEIRQDFPDTAFWRADVRTDAQGKASVAVRLPDNLTTWRMDARAVTDDTRVGQTTFDLVSSKPLLVRPQTPRFFVSGDQVTLGAAVHNNTGENLTVDVALEGQGIDLQGQAQQQVSIAAGQQAYVTWKASVQPAAQSVDLVFSAKSGAYSDASRPTIGSAGLTGLTVYRYEAPETVATSGQISQEAAQAELIRLPAEYPVTQGELTVNVAPSLSATVTDGLTYLEHFPYECTEQTISRFLPNVMVTRVMKEAGFSDPTLEKNLQEQVTLALQRLSNWQRQDGGWGWWKEGASDEQITAYAVLGLLEARAAGYDVSTPMINSALSYLNVHIAALSDSPWLDASAKANRQAFMAYVLSKAGQPPTAVITKLFDDRLKLGLFARALILRSLWMQDPQDPRIDTLRADFSSAAVLSASGTHWEEAVTDRWNWNTDTRTTAIVLGSLVPIDGKNPLVANAVRWLMAHRTGTHWSNTQETAWTLMALADWMHASGELKANYEYAVQLNNNLLSQGKVSPQNLRETQTLRVAVADLLKDAGNELVLARGAGDGNLYYTANLRVYLPVDKIQALDRGVVVSREYYPLDNPNTPVTSAEQGQLLRARLTIVAPKALHYLQVDDPLPAGLEALDTSLLTSEQGQQPEAYSWNQWDKQGYGWWYFDHIELRDEKVSLSAAYLPAGTYIYTYLVRAGLPGAYNVIPPTGQEFYFPEVYGRGDGMLFEVK